MSGYSQSSISDISVYMTSCGHPTDFAVFPPPLISLTAAPLEYREIFMQPPKYPEMEPGGPRPERVKRSQAPPECYFLDSKYTSREEKNKANPKRNRETSVKPNLKPHEETLACLRKSLKQFLPLDPWDPQTDFSEARQDLLLMHRLAMELTEDKAEYLLSCPYVHYPQTLFRDAFYYVASGILLIIPQFYLEPTDRVRYFDDSVMMWMLDELNEILSPDVRSLEPCAERWYQNVKLWSLRNFPYEKRYPYEHNFPEQPPFSAYLKALRHMHRIPLVVAPPPDIRENSHLISQRLRSMSMTGAARRSQLLGDIRPPERRFRTACERISNEIRSEHRQSSSSQPLVASQVEFDEFASEIPDDHEEMVEDAPDPQVARSSRDPKPRPKPSDSSSMFGH